MHDDTRFFLFFFLSFFHKNSHYQVASNGVLCVGQLRFYLSSLGFFTTSIEMFFFDFVMPGYGFGLCFLVF